MQSRQEVFVVADHRFCSQIDPALIEMVKLDDELPITGFLIVEPDGRDALLVHRPDVDVKALGLSISDWAGRNVSTPERIVAQCL